MPDELNEAELQELERVFGSHMLIDEQVRSVIAEVRVARRLRVLDGWKSWPDEEALRSLEADYANHMLHVRMQADLARRLDASGS